MQSLSHVQISKFALVRMTEILHNELIARGINVYAVNPGTIESPLSVKCIIPELMGIFCDTAALAADTHVWLASRRRDWLSGRYVSCNWDVTELEQMQDEIVKGDKLKFTMRI
jgi:NAD(P)-dependent dehydrogenase (short-subunit alcohol dehydrogenase family)